MSNFILRFVIAVIKVFMRSGVDYNKVTIITQTKLMLDGRRVRQVYNKGNTNKDPKNQILITLISYAIIGFVIALFMYGISNILVSIALLHTYLLIMMIITLITDFSTVLLDTTDNQIILPRPVNSATIFVAKLAHILTYLLQFTIALSLLPIVAVFVAYGLLVGLVNIVAILFTIMLAVFFTYILYGLVLKYSNEQRLKAIVNGFQIAFTIFIMVASQLMSRVFNAIDFDTIGIQLHWYSYFIPPLHTAYMLQLVQQGIFTLPHIIMTVLAFGLPLLLCWVLINYIAPSFSSKVATLGNTGSEATIGEQHAANNKVALSHKLSSLVCSNNVERASFEFVWKMTSREKNFKLQFYPGFAYVFLILFIPFFKSGKGIASTISTLSASKSYLVLTYLPFLTIMGAFTLITFSEQFAAAWLYASKPLYKPGSIISGSVKCIVLKYFVPLYAILFCIGYAVWGYTIIVHFVLGFGICFLLIISSRFVGKKYFPFSLQPNVRMQSGKIIHVIINILSMGVLVALHFAAIYVGWLVYALLAIVYAASYALLKRLQVSSWQLINY